MRSLWLCVSLPSLPLEVQPLPFDKPVAISDRQGSRRWVMACTSAARHSGISVGMAITSALALVPELKVQDRARGHERRALKALSSWAQQFTAWVCFDADRWLVWLEVGASLNYFGGLAPLVNQLKQGLTGLGYFARLGIAPTLEAAAVMSHSGSGPCLDHYTLRATLASMPLRHLGISDAVREGVVATGLTTIGELLALPRNALARRWGSPLTTYLQCLLGEIPDVRAPHRSAAIYRRRFEFAEPVESVEGLLFPLRRLLQELSGYLRGRDTALQTLRVTFAHAQRAATEIELRTTAPQRDAPQLLSLLRERLERLTLDAPVAHIALFADQFVSMGDTQLDLFDARPRHAAAWDALLDKLSARLGYAAIKRLGLGDAHRPEHAWCVAVEATADDSKAPDPDRPLWLVDPKPLDRLPRLLGKPERIEAGWWEGHDTSRDYYIAETAEGTRWWLYREASSAQWFLQGLWA